MYKPKNWNIKELIEVNNGNAVLIDVREKCEFTEQHIEVALNLPLSEFHSLKYQAYREKTIYLICSSGKRAKKARDRLLLKGFKAVIISEHMNVLRGSEVKNNHVWSIDRQFRLTLGFLLVIFLIGHYFISDYFLIIPIIISTGLLISSIIDRCYLRIGITKLPWNRNRN